jgi:hypothetical protein
VKPQDGDGEVAEVPGHGGGLAVALQTPMKKKAAHG